MTKIARRGSTENPSEQGTPLRLGRSTLLTRERVFRVVQNQCGRCGVPTKNTEFCSACRKFFLIVNGP